MEKKMVNDVYTIEGIDSTSQLVAFYKEVVEKNIEKYVGITVQGIKFKLNNTGDRAVQLEPNEEYGINPMYRRIEVEPIEELIEEVKEEIVVTPIEEVVTQDQEVPSQEEQHVEEAAPVETYSKEDFEALQMENAQLADKCATLTQERNLNKERAEQSEIREEQLKQRNEELSEMLTQKYEEINKLTAQLNIANKTVNQEELTLDKALDYIKALGYEAFIRKL